MPTVNLRYGAGEYELSLPGSIRWEVLQPVQTSFSPDEEKVVDAALDKLASNLRLCGQVRLPRVLLLVPDQTRRCRLDFLLPRLFHLLQSQFSAIIRILIANGSHARANDTAVSSLLGEVIGQRYEVWQHNCLDEATMFFAGCTSRGTPVFLNRLVREVDWVIAVGGVQFHYFAGFGGGPKMIVPGIAGYETIRKNHSLSIDSTSGRFHPQCREGNMAGNPVYEDLAEAAALLPGVLSLQVLLGPAGRIVAAAAGQPLEVHPQLCARVRKVFGLPMTRRAEVVIASAGGEPADIDLIQCHKAIHHACQALTPGGVLLILARCRAGIGSATFLDYFSAPDSAAISRLLLADYRLNGQTALALRQKTEQAHIILVSDLDAELVRRTGMIPAGDVSVAQCLLEEYCRSRSFGYLFPQANNYLPVIDSVVPAD